MAPELELNATDMNITSLKRVKTGIPGLDRLVEGGFLDKTVIVLIGTSGTGKSTFAAQFLMQGIEKGEQALYVSLEEPPEQIVKASEAMGLDMASHVDKDLFFIHLKGKNFKKMIEEQLPQLVEARSGYELTTRVVIDPMTPVIWATTDKLDQRELIGKLFYTLKQLGVVLCTVEEHAKPGEPLGEDVLLPMYLSDGAVQLEFFPIGGAFNRTLRILKMRNIHHGEGVYPYIFSKGIGIILRASRSEVTPEKERSHGKVFEEAIRTAESLNAGPSLIRKLKIMRDTWDYEYSPEETLQTIFDSYGLKRVK